MENKLYLSSSPHFFTKRNTRSIMLDVIIALLPASAAGIYYFGIRALAVLAVCVGCSVLSEVLFNLAVKKKQTAGDLSAVLTGFLLGLNLSVNVPLWQAAVGSVFAIVIVKCLFGGIGKNVVNPAITARVFMIIAFSQMAQSAFPVDSASGATPLVSISQGNIPPLMDLFLGKNCGAIGETCALALLVGAGYLLVRRVISWHIPVIFIGTVFVFAIIYGGFDLSFATAEILSGGLFLGAIFMATDYVTSPATAWGKVVFGLGAGLITCLIRFWGNYPEGVSFAILLMNILDPYIDIWTTRKLFTGGAK